MPVREAFHVKFPGRLASLILSMLLILFLLVSPLAAKTQPAGGLDAGYVSALGAADRFLQAWQSGDAENGLALLTSHAKEKATTDVVGRFFSNPGPSAYEIGRGKLLKRGRYEFPVVLVGTSKNHSRRRFSSILIVDTGRNDWAVDTLP
jgi:hypothetical protein